ncbi:Ig-like domain-containing protein [Virgibacillus halodenitrificans]|uniref:Ig-like domain-containing protein n=1 Tax=Virgibacillus halodenitrificans TaxID=1482 RepID=UPI000EF547F8|nr:GLUG motif-containing protein [Virgibacillus halodenitrificans]
MDKKKKVLTATLVAPIAVAAATSGNTDVVNHEVKAAEIIQIHTVQDLYNIRLDLEGSYKLMNDIDLSGINWEPIDVFQGTFDGNSHTISGLTIEANQNHVGLFGRISNAVVKDLKIRDVNITNSQNYSGALAGRVNGSNNEGSTVTNVTLEGGTVNGGRYTGGLIGEVNESNVNHSYSTVTVSGTSSTGGLIGEIGYLSDVSIAYASGDVTGDQGVGGLVGKAYGTITDVYATGNVTGLTDVGGLIGRADRTFNNAYATGEVHATSETNRPKGQAGGVVGNVSKYYASFDNILALNTKVTGAVDTANVGIISGNNDEVETGTDALAISTLLGKGHTANVDEMITPDEALKKQTYSFIGFDFGDFTGHDVWTIDEGETLPYLTDMPHKLKYDPSTGSWVDESQIPPNTEPIVSQSLSGETINLSLDPNKTIDISNVFSDPDGDTLNFTVTSDKDSVVQATLDGTNINLTGLVEGSSLITVTAEDGNGGTVSETFYVNVVEKAVQPEFTKATIQFAAIPNATEYILHRNGKEVARISDDGSDFYTYEDTNLIAGQTYVYVVHPVFEDGKDEGISLGDIQTLNLDINVSVSQNEGTASWNNIYGAEGYQVIIKDSSGKTLTEKEVSADTTSLTTTMEKAGKYTVEVTPKLNGTYGEGQSKSFAIEEDLNEAPSASDIPDQQLIVDDAPITLDLSQYFTDPNGDQITYQVTTDNEDVTVSNNEGSLTIIPKTVGQSVVTVTASDGELTVKKTFTVVVKEPVPSEVTKVKATPSETEVALSWDAVTYADEYIVKRDGQEVARVSGTSFTDKGLQEKTAYDYEVIAVNKQGQSKPASVSVKTLESNKAPIGSSIPDQQLKVDDAALTLDLSQYFSDPNGDHLTYQVKTDNGNIAVSNTDEQLTIIPKTVGQSEVTVTASDGELTVKKTFTVVVKEPVPSEVTKVKATPSETEVALSWDAVTYADEYIVKRDGQEVARVSGTSFTDKGLQEKTAYDYEVIAVNKQGQSKPASESVKTLESNKAPIGSSIPDQQLKVDDAALTLDLSQYFSDPNGDQLTYQVKTDNENVAVSNNEGRLTITPKIVGQSVITVIVSDGEKKIEKSFKVVIEESQSEPTEDAIRNIQVTLENTTASITWDKLSEATAYRVQAYVKNEEGNFVKDSYARRVTENAYDYSRLDVGKEYKFEIIPFIDNVYQNEYAGISDRVMVNEPEGEKPAIEVVQNVSASVNGTDATITWDSLEGATRYRVQAYVQDPVTGEFRKDGFARTTSGTAMDMSQLDEGKTYKFHVIPNVDNVYTSEAAGVSNEVTTESKVVEEQPSVDATLHVTMDGTTANLSWDAIEDASRYRIQMYVKDEFGVFVKDGYAKSVSSTEVALMGLKEGTEYKFEITPRVGYIYSDDYMISATAETGNVEEPSEPSTNSTVTVELEGTTANVTWDGIEDASRYRVQKYVKNEETGEFEKDSYAKTASDTTITLTRLDEGAEYKFEVIPLIKFSYDYGSSVTSDVVKVETPTK